jgi:hypothetical protein
VDVVDRRRALERGPHAVAVVLAQENGRELPERGHVQGLVEGSDIGRRFAEETDGDLVGFAVLDGEPGAGGEGDVRPDDGVAAEEVSLDVEQVHRAALPPGAPGLLSEQLRHDGSGGDAAGQRVGVLAIAREDIVVVAQRRDGAHGDGLLADVQVAEPADPALRVRLARLLLEATHEDHLPEQVEVEILAVGIELERLLLLRARFRHQRAAAACCA